MAANMVRPNPEVAATMHALMADQAAQPGKMFASPCYKVNGKMALAVFGDGIVLKPGAARSRALIEAGAAQSFEPMPGRAWREWALLTEGFESAGPLLAEAVAFVRRETGG
ncbi:MAG: hypothetical protein OXB89_00195 [Anaerolineaceae bacterium]|nr:hypothetical protein [Anaerolineaceae bacterium]